MKIIYLTLITLLILGICKNEETIETPTEEASKEEIVEPEQTIKSVKEQILNKTYRYYSEYPSISLCVEHYNYYNYCSVNFSETYEYIYNNIDLTSKYKNLYWIDGNKIHYYDNNSEYRLNLKGDTLIQTFLGINYYATCDTFRIKYILVK